MLAERELAEIDVADTFRELRFDRDPAEFRLGADARSLESAFTHHDMGS